MAEETLLIFQSGGPTAVLNASLAGAISAAKRAGYRRIIGAHRAVEGLLSGAFIELTNLNQDQLIRLKRTPSAALVSSRRRPTDEECGLILEHCADERVSAVVAIGGNDTADTVQRLAELARDTGKGTGFVSVPKTIDNDLMGTDHCLGYGSAGRFLAMAARDSALDTLGTGDRAPIKIIEVMGRNSGWLAAAAGLAFDTCLPAPLICLPERPFASFERFAATVEQRLQSDRMSLIIVPETLRWADSGHVAGDQPEWVDPFGHPYFPSAGDALARRLSASLGVRARCDRPGTITRMAMHAVSEVDIDEAERCGVAAVERLAAGESGRTISIERASDGPYRVQYQSVPIEQVANVERRLPDEMIGVDGTSTTETFRRYAMPLVGAFEPYELLDPPSSGSTTRKTG